MLPAKYARATGEKLKVRAEFYSQSRFELSVAYRSVHAQTESTGAEIPEQLGEGVFGSEARVGAYDYCFHTVRWDRGLVS